MKNSYDRRTLRLLPVLAAACLMALPVATLAEDWFGEAIYSTIPYEPYNFAVGDLNGDGVDDVAYVPSGYLGYLIVLLNDGNGELKHAGTYATVESTLGLGYLDGDDTLDLVSHYSSDIRIFYNDGAGQFTWGDSHTVPWGVLAVAVGDLDGDGRSEVVAESGGVTHLYWNSPDGLSETPVSYPGDLPLQYGACGPIFPEKLVITDATGDGLPDVVIVGNVPNGFCLPEELFRAVGILENLGGRTFASSVAWPLVEQFDGYWWYYIGVADYNQDGLPDISVEPNEYGIRIYYRHEDGHYTMELPGLSWTGSGHTSGDIDGNGTVDVVTDRGGISSRAYRGNGDGTFLIAQSDMVAVKGPQLGHLDQNEGLDVVGFNGVSMRVLPNILFLTSDVTETSAPVPEQIQVAPTILSHGTCTILAPAAGSSPAAEFQVTDLTGRLVTTLSASRASSTQFRATWDGRDRSDRDVPTGWYWIRHGDRTARAGKVLWIR